MLDPRLAQAYKTAETLRFLAECWSTHEPPAMTKEAQMSPLPFMALEYGPALMGMARGAPSAGRGMIDQWLARLMGRGPLSQVGLGLLERHWTKPMRPSLSMDMLSPRNTIKGTAFSDAINQMRAEYGQAPLPIGSMVGG